MSEFEIYATTLDQLESAVHRLAARIDAPAHVLPTFRTYRGDGKPCLQQWDDGFHFVISERGNEYERVVSRDAKEILYLVFETITYSMASDYELAHRAPGVDTRRLAFQRQLELLSQLDSSWERRCREGLDAILKQHPYRDEQ